MPASANPPSPSGRRFLEWPGLWLLLPLSCHFGFSWIGFSPTDEGWLQAIARRLLDGEVPHRDFISIRPVLSAALQIPLVALGGDHLFWLARLWGWLELGAITWLWSGLLIGAAAAPWTRQLAYFAAFFLGAHTFPIMAWHTLDGLVLCSGAVAFAQRGTPTAWRAAFLCAGLAALCRQNFAFFVPFLAFGLPDWRDWPRILWAAAPGLVYVSVITALGGGPDLVMQLRGAQGLLFPAAIGKYLATPVFYLALPTAFAVGWLLSRRRTQGGAVAGAVLFVMIGLFCAGSLAASIGHGIQASFLLLGCSLGWLLARVFAGNAERAALFPEIAAAGLAWVTAISLGYNSPALAGGILLLAGARLLADLGGGGWLETSPGRLAWLILAAALGAAHVRARLAFPYQDRPAAELRWDAGEVLRGAADLQTNPLTYLALQDLRALTDRFEAEHRPYAILSDYSAHWALSAQRNPLLLEWPQATELTADPRILHRFFRDLRQLSPTGVVIMQKHLISAVSAGLVPVQVASGYYAAQEWLRRSGTKIGETPWFELYVPPAADPAEPARP